MSFDPNVLRSADQLKALAHPVRMRIVEELTARGPLTASQLSEVLDESPANCSWHLRKLAAFGFVEESEPGAGRRRPWKMTRIGFTWRGDETRESTRASDADTVAAMRALDQQVITRNVDRYLERMGRPGWDVLGLSDTVAYMTEEEAEQYAADVRELIVRFHDRLTDPAQRPEGARAVSVMVLASVDPLPESPSR